MPYQATRDATVERVVTTGEDENGEPTAIYESVSYGAGAVIHEDDIAPHVLSRLEDGSDDRLSSLLRYVDDDEARDILRQQAAMTNSETAERELLHQEERLGDQPTALPNATDTAAAEYESSEVVDERLGELEDPTTQPDRASDEELVSSEQLQEGEGYETPEERALEETGGVESPEDIEESEEDEAAAETEPESAEELAEGEQLEEGKGYEPPEERAEQEATGEAGEGEEQTEESGDDLDEMSKRQLNAEARNLDIEGRSTMDEDELKAAIREKRAG